MGSHKVESDIVEAHSGSPVSKQVFLDFLSSHNDVAYSKFVLFYFDLFGT